MRAWWLMAGAALLAGCGSKTEKQQAADANAVAANFRPPTVISRLDYGGMVERRFRRLDRNQDDRLTPDELPPGREGLMALDRDGDGAISATEWSEGMLARFDASDANKDGTVTSAERDLARSRKPLATPSPRP